MILNNFSVHGLTFFLAAILSALFGKRLLKTESALNDSLKNFDRLAILYKQIFDNISTGIVTIDGQGIITSANAAVEKIIGGNNQPLTLIGKKLADVFPRIELTKENHRLTTDFQKDDGSRCALAMPIWSSREPRKIMQNAEPPHKIITLRDIS